MMKLRVENMTCGHCVKHITNAIQSLDPEAKVDVDLSSKIVTVDTKQSSQLIIEALHQEDYQAQIVN